MARSGARLIEVGTTNRTRLDDFKHAVDQHGEDAALVLQVHQSNYKIVGFTEAPRTAELAALNRPLVTDIGSGLVDSRCPWLPGGPPGWLDDEPAARQTLEAGADLVTFSATNSSADHKQESLRAGRIWWQLARPTRWLVR